MTNRQIALLAAALLNSGDPAFGRTTVQVIRDANEFVKWLWGEKNEDEE